MTEDDPPAHQPASGAPDRSRTLARRIERGRAPVVDALRIAVDVAECLARPHADGVFHGDLTPESVLVHEDGHVEVVTSAAARPGRQVSASATGYRAPEQQRGAPEDERADVFAIGAILFRMLAGELPFPDGLAEASGLAPMLDVPEAPGLGEAVARMLDRDPVKRPRDAAEVVAVLEPFLRALERTPSTGSLRPARRRRRRLRAGALLAATVVIAAAVAWGTHAARLWGDLRPENGPSEPSLAVLPFADASPGKDHEYLADGLADEILNALASVEGLRVPSRTSCFYFKGRNASLREIGAELQVATVLEGTVGVAGKRVRVTTQLVNVADGRHLWGQTWDRELTDVFAVEDEIARAVVQALEVKLLSGRRLAPAGRETENPEVHAHYLFGRQQYYRYTPQSMQLAVEAYEKALALDPGYAPAWAGLGIPLYNLANRAGTPEAVEAQRRRALAAADRAVELSPDLPDALSTRGTLRAVMDHDWAGAEADLKRAIALNGSDADSHRRYALLLGDLGRIPEAMAQLREAVRLDPFGPSWAALGTLHQLAGELDQAEAAFRRHLEIWPENGPSLMLLGKNLVLQSKPKEAAAIFERLPDEFDRLWGRAVVEHALGHPEASRAALEELTSRYAHNNALAIAEVHAWRGEKDAAFRWLDRAVAQRDAGMSGLFRVDAFLKNLRDDPRYIVLLRKMSLPVP